MFRTLLIATLLLKAISLQYTQQEWIDMYSPCCVRKNPDWTGCEIVPLRETEIRMNCVEMRDTFYSFCDSEDVEVDCEESMCAGELTEECLEPYT